MHNDNLRIIKINKLSMCIIIILNLKLFFVLQNIFYRISLRLTVLFSKKKLLITLMIMKWFNRKSRQCATFQKWGICHRKDKPPRSVILRQEPIKSPPLTRRKMNGSCPASHEHPGIQKIYRIVLDDPSSIGHAPDWSRYFIRNCDIFQTSDRWWTMGNGPPWSTENQDA